MPSTRRLLVVGVGSIGERHVRCFLATGRAQVGICEPNTALREKIAATYPVISQHASLDQALTADWDSVVIATPAPLHLPQTRQAIDAGIPSVLIEKPLAVVPEGAQDVLAAAQARGTVLGLAYVYRAHPALQAMREALVSGQFGQPVQLSVVSGQHFPFYRPAYAQTYYARHASGGGAIQDGLTHLFNAAEWLVGPLTRLAALAEHCVLPGTPEVEDTVSILARHGSVQATYNSNQHQAPNASCIKVVCTRGTCKFEVDRHRWSFATEPGSDWQDRPTHFQTRDDWFTAQEQAWLDVIDGHAAPLCSFEEGLQTLHVNQAALASAARDGAWVNVPTFATASI